jgi:hypothetical protein
MRHLKIKSFLKKSFKLSKRYFEIFEMSAANKQISKNFVQKQPAVMFSCDDASFLAV